MKHLKPLADNEFVPSMITPIHSAPLRRVDTWGWLGHTHKVGTHTTRCVKGFIRGGGSRREGVLFPSTHTSILLLLLCDASGL